MMVVVNENQSCQYDLIFYTVITLAFRASHYRRWCLSLARQPYWIGADR